MNRNEITLRAQANSYEELNKKYESSQLKILRLEERIEELESSKALLQQELELKHIIEKPIIPIVHKIESKNSAYPRDQVPFGQAGGSASGVEKKGDSES